MTGDCVDFREYVDDTDFGREYVLGWFRFRELYSDVRPLYAQAVQHWELGERVSVAGLQVMNKALIIEPTIKNLSFDIIIWMSNGSQVHLTSVKDSVIINDTITPPGRPHAESYTFSGVDTVSLTDSRQESLLQRVCVTTPIDIEKIFGDYLDSETDKNPAIKDILGTPNAQPIMDQILRDLEGFYLRGTPPDIVSDDNDGNGNDQNNNSGGAFHWPPNWDCVLKNAILLAAATVALTALASTLGVPTIGSLARSDAIAVLTETFGLSVAKAETVYAGLAAIGAAGLAVKNCG